MVWDHPGGSRGRLGDHFGPRTAQGSKREPKNRERVFRFWHQNGDRAFGKTVESVVRVVNFRGLAVKRRSEKKYPKNELKEEHGPHEENRPQGCGHDSICCYLCATIQIIVFFCLLVGAKNGLGN